MNSADIRSTPARTTAQIKFTDGQVLEGPLDTTIEEFVRAGNFPDWPVPTACLVNGQLRELTYHADRDLTVKVLTTADSDGMRVYRRSLSFLMVAAAHELYPEAQLIIDYGLNFGAIYCEVEGRPVFNKTELKRIETRMRQMAEADLPIVKTRIPLNEAEALFKQRGADDKLLLLRSRHKPYLTTYTIGDYQDYLHGYMAPSTGYLKLFSLDSYAAGFVLRYPRTNIPDRLQPIVDYPKLVPVFNEYGGWMRTLGIHNVGTLNQVVTEGNLTETILVAEALQEQRIAQIATVITSLHDRVRLVLVSGPSSSGKTTFSKRLAVQLLAHGIQPIPLGLDDFIVDRDNTPPHEMRRAIMIMRASTR